MCTIARLRPGCSGERPEISMITNSEQDENLFARELVQILAAHGLKLEQLADLVDIQPISIQRLQKSLSDPAFAPILSPDELELLVSALLITGTEQRRLKAALLATAIQRLLKSQLGLSSARQIVGQIYPLLLDTSMKVDLEFLGAEERGDHDASEDVEADMAWSAIWEAMDAADLALQLSNGLVSYSEQRRKVQEARSHLEEALAELEGLNKAIRSLPIWRTSHQRASKELKAVDSRLKALEKE
jgi:hypothetical protein